MTQSQLPGFRKLAPAVLAVVRRPGLWGTAIATLAAASPPGWWRRAPYLPRPDRDYLAWRLHTAYGDDGTPAPDEVVDYLEWVKMARRGDRTR
jgi:hypothetical protein